MKLDKLLRVFEENGFKWADYGCASFDATLERDTMIFVLKKFTNRNELENWKQLQEEVNSNLYLKVDNLRKLDIYFVLLISFETRLEDIGLLHEVEKDPYYCRKIIIREDHFDQDKVKLPFLPVPDFEISAEAHRIKTIDEFLDTVTARPGERELAEKIFGLREERRIAEVFLEFSREGKHEN